MSGGSWGGSGDGEGWGPGPARMGPARVPGDYPTPLELKPMGRERYEKQAIDRHTTDNLQYVN